MPHKKSAGRDRENMKRREERKREKRKKRKNKRERRDRKERERRARGKDVLQVYNTPLELSKNYKRHGKGREKSREKTEEETEKARENIMIEDRLRCEKRICVLFKY